MAKKLAVSWCFSVAVALYTTFVLQNLWNWYAVRAFHASEVSFWLMYGLVLMIGMLSQSNEQTMSYQLKPLYTVAEALASSLPEEKREELAAALKDQTTGFGFWLEIGSLIFGKLVGATVVLVVGWTVHTFLA